MRGLGRVADQPDHGVPADDRKLVGGLVVFDQSDQLVQLVDVEAGQELVMGERGVGEDVGHVARVRLLDKVRNRDCSGHTLCLVS